MKRIKLALVFSPLLLGLTACGLPLATGPAETCYENAGFMGQEVSQVSCFGPHDFAASEVR